MKRRPSTSPSPLRKADPEWLESVLVCPACLTPGIARTLEARGGLDSLECAVCHRVYPVDRFGVPDLQVVDKLADLPAGVLEMWDVAQSRAEEEYRERDPGSVASADRSAAGGFADFIDIEGCTVLDVGSGSDYVSAYLASGGMKQYVAIDPLPIAQPVPYTKIQAWAELIPFASDTFDVLLAGTSLDHFVCVPSGLSEMGRVLRPDGIAYVWTALFVDPKWYMNLFPAPLFERASLSRPRRGGVAGHRKELARLQTRISDRERNASKFGGSLVDKYHLRHLPLGLVKEMVRHGLEPEMLDVWEWNYHEGSLFLNAFLRLRKVASTRARISAPVRNQLDLLALLASITEKQADYERDTGVWRGRIEQQIAAVLAAQGQVQAMVQALLTGNQELLAAKQELLAAQRELLAAQQELLAGRRDRKQA